MASKKENYNEALFEGIYANSLDAIISIDEHGVIELFNSSAAKMFGYAAEELIGKNIKILMPKPFCDDHDRYLKHYRQTGQRKVIGIGREIMARKKDGSVFYAHLSVSEAKLADRSVFVGFIRDISEIEETKQALIEKSREYDAQIWLRGMQLNLHKVFRGEKQREELCADILSSIVAMTKSDVGVFYFMENNELNFVSGFAFPSSRSVNKKLAIGEGLSGLAAATNKIQVMSDIKASDLVLESSSVTIGLNVIMAVPLPYEGDILGVIEIGAKDMFLADSLEFMDQVREAIAISLYMALSREKIKSLYEKTRTQAQELEQQANSLMMKNDELAQQSKELQTRQEEIEQNNEELEEQSAALEEQTKQLEESNADLEIARTNLDKKTQDLEQSSRYKAEFLANVSHELRTPLNSIIVLAQIFMENKNANLDENQLESAQTIYNCGHDLLTLINDILDLSKVEANRMDIILEEISTNLLLDNLKNTFEPLAEQKKLKLQFDLEKDFPGFFVSDTLRLEQILRNFLSNAIKFTEHGKIKLHCQELDKKLVFSVIDSGIGISKDRFKDIFVAFQQLDGGVERKYGGTGLGLAIASKLANLLGGTIDVDSELGKGSTFSIAIPSNAVVSKDSELVKESERQEQAYLGDDRANLDPDAETLLIVEDDINFLKILVSFAKQQNFQVLLATNGNDALRLANEYMPDGVILDIRLPEMDGIAVLKALKESDLTRPIPVHVISATSCKEEVLSLGAVSFIKKPVNKQQLEGLYNDLIKDVRGFFQRMKAKNIRNQTSEPFSLPIVMIVDDDERNLFALKSLFEPLKLLLITASNGKEAIDLYNEYPNTALILMDMMLPVISGYEVTKSIRKKNSTVPIIAITAKSMPEGRKACLAAGCTDYMSKPLNTKQLLSLVKIWLG